MNPTPRPSRSLAWLAYRPFRPVLRPLAWRLRSFFIGPVHDELRELRAQIEALRAELHAQSARADAALEPRLAAVLEQALLTLALDHEERRSAEGGEAEPE